jgi:dihydropteroate synthase
MAPGQGPDLPIDPSAAPARQGLLRLGAWSFPPERLLVMAIVNRTPDSFFRPGLTWDETEAMERVQAAIAEGADIIDIGGVPARPGHLEVAEEIRRVVPFIAAVRTAWPDVAISVDTYRHEVGREACAAGANLINDTWGGWDERLAEAAAEHGAGLVCAHAGGLPPRTRPFRVAYADVMTDVVDRTVALAHKAISKGVDPQRILLDPAHDFGKNTWHSLEVTRRLSELTAAGWPVLVSVSRKDFIGEALGLGIEDRQAGTLATAAVCAWQGARVFRVHDVVQTRHVLDMISVIRGDRMPERTVRGLA